jgi:hypothetical protein
VRNSEFILRALDDCLSEQLSIALHLLGGAALDLVYGVQRFSEDVDCMCAMDETDTIDSALFQDAVTQANERLQPHGLYLTHVFDENALVHTADWRRRVVAPPPGAPVFRQFRYDALSPEDIIVQKLTRFDQKDQADVRDLMHACGIAKADLAPVIAVVSVPQEWQETWTAGLRRWSEFVL